MDANLGALIVNRRLDDVDGRTFSLAVTARDNAPPHHSVSSILHVTVNSTVPFVGELGRGGGGGGGGAEAGGWLRVLVGSHNVLIVVVLSAVSAVIAVVLIVAICLVVRRQDAHGKQVSVSHSIKRAFLDWSKVTKSLQDPLEVGNDLPGIDGNVRERGLEQQCF